MASRHRNASPVTAGKDSPQPASAATSLRLVAEFPLDAPEAKESVTVTVRFRPLSSQEVRLGEEIAWYADGDTIVRSEQNHSIAYAYDRVFGPTTTTRHVYDAAALHVISGAMEGINGTIFAYGVTSSGKTHTMHGDQRSPGIIPLAVKDAFSIIQETPKREFLLRVSYLEIYNEVVNDLLNPSGQNLRIREDLQGTFVEGIKEEVVLSPAHALSLIAAGEEHRHVGSTNFNLLSSRSHTIFTLTIESSGPCSESSEEEAVTFSQLNLIDLAGSESSRAETTGVRRKEGSYINKSLLTLGTVISKLTDGKATHVPFRDSKLTRLLQSSLSGQGRVSLICTVTPASSNSEETRNTLKFAHRAKHIEIQVSQNKIMDEKSLIKKYQNEICQLKEELDQLKRGILSGTPSKDATEDNVILWKQKLEDGNVKLQSRLEQEEAAKAALLARIQRLTKLILVSTKATQTPRLSQCPRPRRRHSFGEEELACLPHRRRDIVLDGESNDLFVAMEGFDETFEVSSKGENKNRKGLLNWFKLRKHDGGSNAPSLGGDQSSLRKALAAPWTPVEIGLNSQTEQEMSNSPENLSANLLSIDHEEFHSDGLYGEEASLVTRKTSDHVDLLREQLKILSEEVALHKSVLKRLVEGAGRSTMNGHVEIEMKKVSDEIKDKQQQIAHLERQIKGELDQLEHTPSHATLLEQVNEKAFELEVKTADNRILQDQLQQKTRECQALEETVAHLHEQLSQALEANDLLSESIIFQQYTDNNLQTGSQIHIENPESIDISDELHQKAEQSEIDELKQRLCELTEAKTQLETHNQKLQEESMYAKGLASAAGVELKALSGEVTKLMNHNERLANDLALARNSTRVRSGHRVGRRDSYTKRLEPASRRDVHASSERESALEVMLMAKDQREAELQKKIEESKQKEAFLEGELANMWVLVAKLKKGQVIDQDDVSMPYPMDRDS
ncbi:kinesin-like protein KIN-7D, chloroplastic isoform X1 [Zea mays]|uniref:Kinesin-like protein n=3 Tax=Zea mays TaxID=4577 RepID=A0A1D6NSM0_MAIZE|nr:kinesin-like protein KIN-7D, chloroplastic isoform X1 [Zea mays]AQL01251.1 Kinesin-like protein KIN-7K chloroplastic [Zea mays]|eukprot:XP_008659139.1 kinesin-like protein KIN-7D, chloroplastic isoform X1 [Zea mays]